VHVDILPKEAPSRSRCLQVRIVTSFFVLNHSSCELVPFSVTNRACSRSEGVANSNSGHLQSREAGASTTKAHQSLVALL